MKMGRRVDFFFFKNGGPTFSWGSAECLTCVILFK